MKQLLLILCLLTLSAVHAKEVDTECPAMNENREKVIKSAHSKPKPIRSNSTRQ